ncbi:MAG TPA: LuxR C-terminal-related transcriptional regulator [Aggregatilineaceae bacterium]|nr:LuxR C-terminal-related transcriptional regulator [Aggregatilineaceae bacterium]
MSTPLLATKLYLPPPRPGSVIRRRLLERLNEGLHRKLTLVSAPAGFGKTTLISEWLVGCGQPVAWLSLDEADNDFARFLVYLETALQPICAGLASVAGMGEAMFGAFPSTQPPSVELLLTPLLNQLAAVPHHFILALDDCHVIHIEPIDQALAFLLEHLPPQMHLLLSTREDPNLSLARLRATSQLIELRAAELRFTPDETTEFLNQVMNLGLSLNDITALDARTEGWIVGLQLAALSLQGRADRTNFIQAFTGSHRFVLDYLVEEVLRLRPPDVLSFLLQTSILDRLSGPLCDAVTMRNDGRAMLDALERENLFIVPLDDQRHWYRYHHLFADALQSRLADEQPDQIPDLHRRASIWYEQNGLPAEAIHHALAAQDLERAASLIERVWSTMVVQMQSSTWLGWARTLPEDVIRVRPVLCVGYAWALLDSGDMETCEVWLQNAARWLETPSPDMIVVDKDQFQVLGATVATARAYRALALGDTTDAIQQAQQALTGALGQDRVERFQAMALLGIAQYANGDLSAADRSLTEFRAYVQKLGASSPTANITLIGITFVLADIKRARGRLHEAASAYEQALRLAASQGEPMPVGTADLYRGLGELACERGDLDVAAQHLLTAQKLGQEALLPGWPHRRCIAEALLKQAQGDLVGALDLLDEAERLYIRSPLPDVYPIAALRARIWVMQGKLTEALMWARERGLSTDDAVSYLREFEHLTLARIHLALYRNSPEGGSLRAAMNLLERLLQAAEAGDRIGSVIEISVLQALAHEAQNDIPHALVSLEQALTLAQPEGYVRRFVDEGQSMMALLQEADRRRIAPNYVSALLAAFAQPGNMIPATQPLIEPLSERELEILRLLGTELSGPEIADQLMISLSTVRTHTQNIYAKLGANNRRTAIRHAEELGLL